MNDPRNIKDQIKKLLESDQRYQAIRLIQNTYGITEADAEKLLSTLDENESQQQPATQSTAQGCGGCFSGVLKIGSILVGLLGLLFLAATAFFYYFYEDFKKDAIPVKGIVADTVYVAPISPSDTTHNVYLVLEYEVEDSVYTYQTATTYSKFEYHVLDSVDLLVNGNDPSYASLAADNIMNDFYLIFGIAGMVMLFVAGVLWFLSRSKISTQ
jgi:hypothetical protein